MITDPIADYLTRVRNAIKANHRVVEVPASNIKKEITKILFDKGYILSYKFVDETAQGTIKIALKYDPKTRVSAIQNTNLFTLSYLSLNIHQKHFINIFSFKNHPNNLIHQTFKFLSIFHTYFLKTFINIIIIFQLNNFFPNL